MTNVSTEVSIATEPTAIAAALKEWAVAVRALAAGQTILLLRKGGIKEVNGRFEVAERQFWLYPTYEHQKPHLVKPDYSDRVSPVPSGWHPETVEIGSWARITNIFSVSDADPIAQLLPYHIWNEQFTTERLKWKPRQPIYLLLLRIYNLEQPRTIPYDAEYGGCRSWIALKKSIAIAPSHPALSDAEYRDIADRIRAIVG